MKTTFTEDSYEKVLIALFQELGYHYECGYDIERDYRNPLHEEYLEGALSRINKSISSYGINELLKTIKSIDGANLLQKNEKFMDMLQNGVSVEDRQNDGTFRHVLAKLIDFEHPEANDFRIVNQWTVDEYEKKRPDLVVFVNGLPLVVMELKSPSSEAVGDDDAYNQIKKYQQVIPCLFQYNCFNVTSDMLASRVGTLTAKKERYMEWKTKDGDYESTAVADYKTFFEGIFKRETLIDLIQNYICFDKGEGKTGKILAGYHQYYAVNKALERTYKAMGKVCANRMQNGYCSDYAEVQPKLASEASKTGGDGKIGVFWHTQGSGKSLSMVFFAHLLISHFAETTIVVVTDRKDLDQQLYGQFARCKDFIRIAPSNARSREELIELLKDRQSGGVIFTTIQKFEDGEEPLSLRKNIIVMTDEAHRSQYGDEYWDSEAQKMKKGYAMKMREALPNASFIGFTGTPISDRDKDTQEVFGDYIDIYDMTQAVEDGATRPVYYESRVVKLDLNKDIVDEIDKEFDKLLDLGATDEQVERSKKDVSRLEAVLSADQTIDSLVRDIIDHYEKNRADELTGKAMIVALTRSVGIKIYKKILELRPDWTEKVKCVMTASNKDPEDWHEILGTDAYKKELARKFKDDNDPMKIAIVRDMWLTGFDVPSLATMYVYKAMSGHNLMQAIARVNRVFPGKEGGLIVDYIGIAQALKQAMNDYTKRDQNRFGDPDIAKTALLKFREEQDICRDQLHGFDYKAFFEDDNTKKANTFTDALNFILAPAKEQQKKDFIEHSRLLHNAQTLCRSLLSEKDKLEVAFFDALRVMIYKATSNVEPKVRVGKINEHINELLKQSIMSDGVINLFKDAKTEFSLFDEKFIEELKKMKEKNIALELLKKLLKNKLVDFKHTNLVQSEKFSAMLTDSLNRYIKGLITNEEVIKELVEIAKGIKAQEEEGNKLGLTKEEKAFYDALSKPELAKKAYTDEQFVELTRELTECLRRNRTIDWNHKESARAQMRVMIKRLLKKYKYPPEGAEEALQTVMDQCDNWAENEENFEGIYKKLVSIEEDSNVSSFVHSIVEMNKSLPLLKLVTECQKEFGEKYPYMNTKDWIAITQNFAKERTMLYVINTEEMVGHSLAAEPGVGE